MNIKTVAKGLIVAAMSMFALSACTDEEKMTPEEALRMMSKSNISDAKYIYIRQATGTRTDGGEEEEIDPMPSSYCLRDEYILHTQHQDHLQ